MADTSLSENELEPFLHALHIANNRAAKQRPALDPRHQPLHVFYGGAHLFKAKTVQKLGAIALHTLQEYAPDASALASALEINSDLAHRIYPRIVNKLISEPIEDFRIDFEDGFGHRSDREEDRCSQEAASEVAKAMHDGTLPQSIGIRIKPLSEELKHRSLRTFDMFLTKLLVQTGGRLPPNFVITLPKITEREQVTTLAMVCDVFERSRQLAAGTLQLELMIETTQAILAEDGSCALPHLVLEGRGRIRGVHFGVYDYTAACGITAAYQHIAHPACDFARQMMLAALSGTGIWLSDGPTNMLPIGSPEVVHRAWRQHFGNVRQSLVNGFYQGWDLHPAQLPARYAAVFNFFLEGIDSFSERFKNFVANSAQASRSGNIFDDAATGQALANHFLRAIDCGAISKTEALEKCGLTHDELHLRLFVK